MEVVLIVVGVVAIIVAVPLLSWALQRKRSDATSAAMGAAFDQVEAIFNPGKQREIDQRQHEAEAPEENPDGAPPRSKVDLAEGQAIIRLPKKDQPSGPSGA